MKSFLCKKDALQKENSGQQVGHKMDVAIRLMASSVNTLTQCTSFTLHNISMEVLEGVAKMRYGLQVVAELLQLQANTTKDIFSSNLKIHGHLASTLLEKARCITCSIYVLIACCEVCPLILVTIYPSQMHPKLPGTRCDYKSIITPH